MHLEVCVDGTLQFYFPRKQINIQYFHLNKKHTLYLYILKSRLSQRFSLKNSVFHSCLQKGPISGIVKIVLFFIRIFILYESRGDISLILYPVYGISYSISDHSIFQCKNHFER